MRQTPDPKLNGNALKTAVSWRLTKHDHYSIEHISTVWFVRSISQMDIPGEYAGVLFEPRFQPGCLVFTSDPDATNWAEDNNLEVFGKWVNPEWVYREPRLFSIPVKKVIVRPRPGQPRKETEYYQNTTNMEIFKILEKNGLTTTE